MTKAKNVVRVSILGEEYAIRSETSPEETMAVAAYLDDTIKSTLGPGGAADSKKAAILAALRITGELFEARQASRNVAEAMRALSDEIRPLLPPAKR
jgi:cell division protein ZapA (FtsZ GTPase activity inhibitor)